MSANMKVNEKFFFSRCVSIGERRITLQTESESVRLRRTRGRIRSSLIWRSNNIKRRNKNEKNNKKTVLSCFSSSSFFLLLLFLLELTFDYESCWDERERCCHWSSYRTHDAAQDLQRRNHTRLKEENSAWTLSRICGRDRLWKKVNPVKR